MVSSAPVNEYVADTMAMVIRNGEPPARMFYNPWTFQIHSKGRDRRTGWNSGTDLDDANNYGSALPPG